MQGSCCKRTKAAVGDLELVDGNRYLKEWASEEQVTLTSFTVHVSMELDQELGRYVGNKRSEYGRRTVSIESCTSESMSVSILQPLFIFGWSLYWIFACARRVVLGCCDQQVCILCLRKCGVRFTSGYVGSSVVPLAKEAGRNRTLCGQLPHSVLHKIPY